MRNNLDLASPCTRRQTKMKSQILMINKASYETTIKVAADNLRLKLEEMRKAINRAEKIKSEDTCSTCKAAKSTKEY